VESPSTSLVFQDRLGDVEGEGDDAQDEEDNYKIWDYCCLLSSFGVVSWWIR